MIIKNVLWHLRIPILIYSHIFTSDFRSFIRLGTLDLRFLLALPRLCVQFRFLIWIFLEIIVGSAR